MQSAKVHRLTFPLNPSPEHAGDRHAEGEEADAALQQRQRGRDDGVLRAGERRRRAEQTLIQTATAPGQSPGVPPIRVLQSGEEPASLWVSHTLKNQTNNDVSYWLVHLFLYLDQTSVNYLT